MADEVLGITGVVNLDDIKNSFEGLISSLERVGAKTDELSEQMTKALSDIASSNGSDKASKAMEVLRNVIASANKELGETPLMIANASKEVSNIEKAIAKLEEKQGKSIVGSKDFDSINKQLENERQALQTAKEDVEDLTQSQTAAQQSVSDLLELYGKLAGNIDTATTAKENANEATEKEKRSIKELRDEYKQYQKDIQEINDELERLNSERAKQQNKATRYQSKSDALAANGATKGGYDSQSAAYRNSLNELEKAKKKLEEIDAVQARLNSDLEQYTKEAEDVKDAIDAAKTKTPTAEYRTLRNEIIALSMEYKNLSDEEKSSAAGQEMKQKLDELKEAAAELKQQMNATNKELKNEASPTEMFQGVSQGLSLLVSGFATAEGAASALGLSEKDLAEVQTILQSSLAANNFLTETRTALLKSSALMLTINTVQEWASQKAIDAETAAKGRGVIATTALTLAQKAFNLVAKANPYVLLATALLTVVGAVAGLTIAYRNNKKAAEEAQKAAEERKAAEEKFASTVADTASKQIVSYQKLRREWSALGNDMKAKKKFITDNQEAFHQLGFSVNGLMDAEKLLVNNTNSVVNALVLRAEAAAYEQRITDLTAEKIKKEEQIKNTYRKAKAGDTIDSTKISGLEEGLDYTTRKRTRGGLATDRSSADTVYTYTLTERGAYRENVRRNNEVYYEGQRKKSEIETEYNNAINSAVKGLTDTQKKINKTLSSAGIKTYTPSKKNGTPSANDKQNAITSANDKYDETVEKNTQERVNAELKIEQETEEARIAAIADAGERERKERAYQHKKDMQQLAQQRDAAIQAEKDRQKAEFDAQQAIVKPQGGKIESFDWDKHGDKTATDKITKQYEVIANYKETSFTQDKEQENLESLRNYLKEYGTFQQKKLAIAEEYAEKIKKAQESGNVAEQVQAEQEYKVAIEGIDMEALKKSLDWEGLFNDLDKYGTKALENLKKKLQDFLKTNELSPENIKIITDLIDKIKDTEGSKEDTSSGLFPKFKEISRLKDEADTAQGNYDKASEKYGSANAELSVAKFGVTQELKKAGIDTDGKDITAKDKDKYLKKASEKGISSKGTENLSKAFDVLFKKEDKAAKAAEELGNSHAELENAQEKAKVTAKQYCEALAEVGTYMGDQISQAGTLLSELGMGSAGEKVSQVGAGVTDAANAAANFASGNYVGAALSAVSAVKNFGSALGIGHGNSAEVQKTTERLTKSNERLRESVDKLKDEIADSGGWRAISSAQEAEKNQAQINKQTMDILKAQMSYTSAHHSNAHYWGLDSADYASLNESLAAYKSRHPNADTTTNSVYSLEDIYKLTPEQMDYIRTYNIEMWNKMLDEGKYDKSEYWENYADLAGEMEEITDSLKEALTQTSFDSLRSSFVDSLLDMESDAADFADDFSENMMKAILNAKISDLLDSELEKFYDTWAEYAESGNTITAQEQETLRKMYDEIAQKGLEIRDQVADFTGYDELSESSQSSTSGSYDGMTQDQGNEISGRLTAMQWNGEQQLQYAIQQTALMTTVQLDTTQMRMTQETIRGYVSELVDIQQDSLSNLQKIVVNTNPLPEMKGVLDNIYKKIKNL